MPKNEIMVKATAGVIVIDKATGQVLLTRRNVTPFKGFWCFPGGHIEQNEPVLDAAKREVLEETGLVVDPVFLGYFDEIFPDMQIHNVVIAFWAETTGTPNPDPVEVSDWGWFSLDEALEMELAFGHNEVLRYFRANTLSKE